MTDKGHPPPANLRYLRNGHPSIDELMSEQHVVPTDDARQLLGDFWPEDESVDDFIAAVREWRGHLADDRAA